MGFPFIRGSGASPEPCPHLLVLGDSERPPLCGVHLSQMQRYSAVHKSHSAVVAVLGATQLLWWWCVLPWGGGCSERNEGDVP